MSEAATKEDLEELEARLTNNFKALLGPVKNDGILNKTTIKQNAEILKRYDERIDGAEKVVNQLAKDQHKAFQDSLKNSIAIQIQNGFNKVTEQIRELIKSLTSIHPTSDQPNSSNEVGVLERLEKTGIDIGLFETFEGEQGIILKPKRYLDDKWGPINDAVTSLGGRWISAGKESRWEVGGAQPAPRQDPYKSRQYGKPRIKDPTAKASNKQLEFLRKLGIRYDSNITKQEASNLIDHKLKQRGQ